LSEIASSSNEKFKTWKTLLTSKGIREQGQFLVSGEKLIRELRRDLALQTQLEIAAELTSTKLQKENPSQDHHRTFTLTPNLLRELDESNTGGNLLVVNTPPLKSWEEAQVQAQKDIVLLCPLGDPSNLGALLRSAEAFGVTHVVLLRESASAFLPKAVKASSGSAWRMQFYTGPGIQELSGLILPAIPFVALDQNGETLHDWNPISSGFLLVGEEGPGLPKKLPAHTQRLRIPTERVESLNATVAISLLLYKILESRISQSGK